MKVLIFSNGELTPGTWSSKLAEGSDLIIAADGGARHALKLGLKVDHLIGDMDSISLEDFTLLKTSQCKVHFFPQDKEKTDLELALDLAVSSGATEIHILSGEGGRFDHQIGNALLASSEKYKDYPVWFYSKLQRARALYPAESFSVDTVPGSLLSIIPLCHTVEKFSIEGVQWPLKSVKLELGSTFTISNRATHQEVKISFESGTLLLIIEDL